MHIYLRHMRLLIWLQHCYNIPPTTNVISLIYILSYTRHATYEGEWWVLQQYKPQCGKPSAIRRVSVCPREREHVTFAVDHGELWHDQHLPIARVVVDGKASWKGPPKESEPSYKSPTTKQV